MTEEKGGEVNGLLPVFFFYAESLEADFITL